MDNNAARTVNHCEEKPPLVSDPFINFFEYGNADGKEGYWSYDHTVLQVEDVLDMFTVQSYDQHSICMVWE
eukprot:11490521-Ditylum_brightwellii.AAC.1